MIYQITFSPTGGCKKVADILTSKYDEVKHVDLLKEGKYPTFFEDDLCVVVCPSFGGRLPYTCAERLRHLRANNAKVILVCVYGNRHYEDTLLEMKDICDVCGFTCIGAICAIAQHSIIHEFGENRPDAQDKKELLAFMEQIYLKGDREIEFVPGEYPYKPLKNFPLHPYADKHCTKCGVCVEECPVGAISLEDMKDCDSDICISCMRCIAICPSKARKNNPALVLSTKALIKKGCETRKENELFL